MNVPKIRFNEFKNEWQSVKIKDIADVIGGGTPSTENSNYWNGGIQWFTPSEIGKEKYVSKSIRTITEEGLNNSSAKLLPIGTILLSSRATIGEASILLNEASTNQGFQSLVVKKNYNNEYVYYLINKIKKDMLTKSFGSTFLEISKSNLEQIKVNIADSNEQKKIADFLSLLDKKIELQSKKIEALKLYKSSTQSKLLSKEYFDKFETSLFEDVCNIQTGKSNTQDKDENGIYPFYIRSEEIQKSNKYIFDCEAVLTIGDGNIGKVFFYENGKFDCHQRVYVLNNFRNVLGKYLYYYFELNFYKRAISMSAKNTVDSVRQEMISKMKIDIPEEKQQIQIINILDKINYKYELEKDKLNRLVQLKKGLMQNMFV